MRSGRSAAVFAAVLTLTGCAAGDDPPTALVQLRDGGDEIGTHDQGSFQPAVLTVAPGTEVRWRNDGSSMHTVTTTATDVAGEPALPAGAQPWDSGPLWPKDTFAHRFDVPGTYVYWCTEHREEQMVGTVRVEEDR
jgi:plastocyanin